jgi:hypothetical protein
MSKRSRLVSEVDMREKVWVCGPADVNFGMELI